jgi:16S rRNA (uracil1498-N3)-methyltransferase
MQRIYLENTDLSQEVIFLKDKELVHQLIRVLRIRWGEQISLFDWENKMDYIYEISEIWKKEILLNKVSQQENNSEINFELSLYNALPNKLEKIEYIIQKGTEIWFTQFNFFRTDRSQKLVISDNKLERLKKIITEAAEQSGRSIIPKINISDDFDINNLPDGKNIFFHTQNEKSQSLKSIEKKVWEKINLFVWPEWGWSENEVEILEKSTSRIHLGNRILRTETTGIVTGFYIIQS